MELRRDLTAGELTPAEKTLMFRLLAHRSHAKHDPAERCAKARAGMERRFWRQAEELHPGASEKTLARVAEQLKKAYYTELQLKSAIARREKSAGAAVGGAATAGSGKARRRAAA